MTPSRSDLALPGDIPGLLRRGSPVVVTVGRYAGRGATVVRVYDDAIVNLGIDDIAAAHVERYEAAEVALDLTDPTGRAHAAWWLARWWQEHRGGGASEHPLMGSVWHRCGDTSWRLSWPYTDTTWGINVPSAATYVDVATLASMSGVAPDDPRILPDGSRWVDAEALRRVVLHVAGRTP